MQEKGRAAEAEHQHSSSSNNNDMEVDGGRWKEQKTTHGQLAAHAIIPIVVLPWAPRRAKKGSVSMYVFFELYVLPLQIKHGPLGDRRSTLLHFFSFYFVAMTNTYLLLFFFLCIICDKEPIDSFHFFMTREWQQRVLKFFSP